jgi:hypothetical protein
VPRVRTPGDRHGIERERKNMDLQTLLDERAITRQLARFARAMDERDWDTVAGILLPDATSDVGTGPLHDTAALIAVMRSFLDACGPTQHLIGNVLIEVDGNTATSRAYVSDLHLGTGEYADLTFSTLGDYQDGWEKHDGAWRMAHRLKVNRATVGSMKVFASTPGPQRPDLF